MKNNEQAPFSIGQRVVAIRSWEGSQSMMGYNKDDEFTVSGNKQSPHLLLWHSSFVGRPDNDFYDSKAFAPIREIRTHKRIAVPEELLHIVERDTIEPVKIKV